MEKENDISTTEIPLKELYILGSIGGVNITDIKSPVVCTDPNQKVTVSKPWLENAKAQLEEAKRQRQADRETYSKGI